MRWLWFTAALCQAGAAPVDPTCLQLEQLDTAPQCGDVFQSSLAAATALNSASHSLLQLELVRVVTAAQRPTGGAPGDFYFAIDLLVGSSRACRNDGPPFSTHYEYVGGGSGGRRAQCPVEAATLHTVNARVHAHGRPPVRQWTLIDGTLPTRTDEEQVLEGLAAERAAERQEANAIVGDGAGADGTERGGRGVSMGRGQAVGLPESPAGGARTEAPPPSEEDGGTLVTAGDGPSMSALEGRLGRVWHRHTSAVVAVLVLLCCCAAPRRRQRSYAPVVSADFDMDAYRKRMAQKYNLDDTATQPQRFSV